MTPHDYAILAKRAYTDAPTVGAADSASRMHVYDGVHVFRGTDDVTAAIADMDFGTVDVWNLGRVHAGFYGALTAILPSCLALPRPSAVVGHSLGAAMAILYAAVLAELGATVPVYAFEPPRLCVGHSLEIFLRSKGVPFYASRNGNDGVTEVPMGMALPGPITQIGTPMFPVVNIADHSIDRVIAALAAG